MHRPNADGNYLIRTRAALDHQGYVMEVPNQLQYEKFPQCGAVLGRTFFIPNTTAKRPLNS